MLGQLQFISGTIQEQEAERLKRLIFRATRGKALTLLNSFIQGEVLKTAYMVVF